MGSLNDRMTELADAVRLKSGATGELSIKDMIIAMDGITVADDLGYSTGTFTATTSSTARTISHGLGHVPGAVIFIKLGAYESSLPSSSSTTLTDVLFSAVYGDGKGYAYCYNSVRKATSSSSTTTSRYWTNTTANAATQFGTDQTVNSFYITSINATTFTTPKALAANEKYLWIAFRAPLK